LERQRAWDAAAEVNAAVMISGGIETLTYGIGTEDNVEYDEAVTTATNRKR
jgi:hypothetical protein